MNKHNLDLTLLAIFSMLIVTFAGSGVLQAASTDIEPAQPNVLFISIDDLNDWIEPLGGHPQAKTPNFNRLARHAVNFSNAHCPSPGCNPSRTAIMTGLAPYTSGVYSNYQDWREVITDSKTLGAMFRTNGYYTAGAGKIYHYHMVDETGWDDYWPSQTNNMPEELFPDKSTSRFATPENPQPTTMNMPMFHQMYGMFDWCPLDAEDSDMADDKSVDYVIEQMNREDQDKPFFLGCGIYRPHLPWYVPQQYFDMFPLDTIQLPPLKEGDFERLSPRAKDIALRGADASGKGYHAHVIEAGQWKPAVQGYLASIAFADAMLGRLLDALEESDHADNTIVVVWSDHGWQLGEKDHWRKFALWENACRSVLMIHVPDEIGGMENGSSDGQACTRPVSLQDIYPTLVDLCDLPAQDRIDGHSLKPLLADPTSDWEHVAISTYDFGEFSVRDETFRYTIYIDGSEELYDLESDPHEWQNLTDDPSYTEVKQRLAGCIPAQSAPLVKTSEKLKPHHIPPFRSRDEYQEWLEHGKSNQYLLNKYWQ
jgi:arylsulfatase A-like enzyme